MRVRNLDRMFMGPADRNEYRIMEGIEFALYEYCSFTIDNEISSTLSTRRSVGKDFAFNSFHEQYDYHLRHKL